METKKLFLFLLLFMAGSSFAQVEQENKSITVNFTEKEISINGSVCFRYAKNGNDFTISNSNGKEIIQGFIRKNLRGSFESVIVFIDIDKTFTNKKVVGRNDLIFSLLNYKVIGPDCHYDLEKLKKFIAENNGK